MPSKSPAQAKLMRAVAHGWKPDRMKGPSRKVAKEFVAADKKVKGYRYGGLKKVLAELKDKRTFKERMEDRYGTESLTLKQARKRSGKKGVKGTLTAVREMKKAGWTPDRDRWYPPQATATGREPTEGGLAAAAPVRTIDPVPGREFISGDAPPRQFAAAPPRRAAADVAPGFNPGRVPPALVQYLQSLQGGAPEEPVKMQMGGAMNFLFRGRGPQQAMQQMKQRGQPPGGGMTSDQGMQKFLRRGQVPGGGRPQPGGAEQFAFEGKLPKFGQGPARGGVNTGVTGGGFKGIGRAPGAGVPLRGVGRPPGMGRPGAGGGAGDYQSMLQQRQQQATAPGAGGPTRTTQPVGGRQFMPGGGGAGTQGGGRIPSNFRGMLQQMRQQQPQTGGANRIGMGDQQGALARASQVQTGRPPISRRQPFPGGPGGGFGRRRGRGRGRMHR